MANQQRRHHDDNIINISSVSEQSRIFNNIYKSFENSKTIELRAVGFAIQKALRIAQRIVQKKIAEYIRLISQPIQLDGKQNVLVIIKLRLLNGGLNNFGELENKNDRQGGNRIQSGGNYQERQRREINNKRNNEDREYR